METQTQRRRAGEFRDRAVDGVVYVTSNDVNGSLWALQASTGTVLWRDTTGGHMTWSSPAVANGVVYVGSDDGNVYAFGLK